MPIHFDSSRWDKVKETHRQWWAGTLGRPIIQAFTADRDPGPMPDAPKLTQANCADLSIPVEKFLDRIEWELSHYTFHGDCFPNYRMTAFGPGVVAAFAGAILDNSTGAVWFHPPERRPIEEIHIKFDPDNVWFRRHCEFYKAAMDRWQGLVQVSMTDLGGILDILSTFRPGDELLMDLYDSPEEVHRLVNEAHDAWHAAYQALNDVLQPYNPGYTAWTNIFSEDPGCMLQCDFAYMIGTDMYDAFAIPELRRSCAKFAHPFYHLDGKGCLPHLDSLLSISELKGVQWVPGTGSPDCHYWPEVYRKIAAAGKKIHLYGGRDHWSFELLDIVAEQVGSARDICYVGARPDAATLKRVAEYGAEIFI